MISRRGFLAAAVGLAVTPSLIETLKPEPLFGDGFFGWSLEPTEPVKDAYEAYYTSYSKIITIDRADMQAEDRTFVEYAQSMLNEISAHRLEELHRMYGA